jgi:peptide/nickel transport system permease protein
MARYLLVRLVNAVPVLVLVSFLVFLITYLLPGDPATVILGLAATPESLAAVRDRLGLDQPLLQRYLVWIGLVLQGDLGTALVSRLPVTELLARALPVTLQLTVGALVIALAVAIPLGIVTAVWRGTWIDSVGSLLTFAGLAVPGFWLGILLIYLFAVELRWLPASGYVRMSDGLVDNLRSMILPWITLGAFLAAPLTRYLRSSMIAVLAEDYVITAEMKGISPRRVVLVHAARNALIPFVTVLGMQFAYLLGGTIIIEEVFALPGMGRLAFRALFDREYPVLQAVALVVAGGFVIVNLVVDLVYAYLDPRVRYGGASPRER